MSTASIEEARAIGVVVDDERITAMLTDDRVISIPLSWSWKLEQATPAQRANYQLIERGSGFHWPDVDEVIKVEGMLRGSHGPTRMR